MMKWILISVGSTIGSLLGWMIGEKLFDQSAALWLSFLLGLVGTWYGWKFARDLT